MSSSCRLSHTDQSGKKSQCNQHSDQPYNLPAALSLKLFQQFRNMSSPNQYHCNHCDHNGRQGINRRIDPLCHIIYNNRNIFHTISGHKIRNHKIIKGHGKCKKHTCKNPILYHRNDYLNKCLCRRCPQIHSRIGQIWVKASDFGIYAGDHVGSTKSNMCQQHGQITLPKAKGRKQKHQSDSCYNIRIQNRQIINI